MDILDLPLRPETKQEEEAISVCQPMEALGTKIEEAREKKSILTELLRYGKLLKQDFIALARYKKNIKKIEETNENKKASVEQKIEDIEHQLDKMLNDRIQKGKDIMQNTKIKLDWINIDLIKNASLSNPSDEVKRSKEKELKELQTRQNEFEQKMEDLLQKKHQYPYPSSDHELAEKRANLLKKQAELKASLEKIGDNLGESMQKLKEKEEESKKNLIKFEKYLPNLEGGIQRSQNLSNIWRSSKKKGKIPLSL